MSETSSLIVYDCELSSDARCSSDGVEKFYDLRVALGRPVGPESSSASSYP